MNDITISLKSNDMTNNALTSNIQILLDPEKCRAVESLAPQDIPETPGLYAIYIKNPNILPEILRNDLTRRNETLLYIGKTEKSLRERLWGQELHAQRPATFFRTMGAILGFRPAKGSLRNKRNQCNYRFPPKDKALIIQWMEHNLLVNFIAYSHNLSETEKNLIQEVKPLMNIQHNPQPCEFVIQSREECRRIARSL